MSSWILVGKLLVERNEIFEKCLWLRDQETVSLRLSVMMGGLPDNLFHKHHGSCTSLDKYTHLGFSLQYICEVTDPMPSRAL